MGSGKLFTQLLSCTAILGLLNSSGFAADLAIRSTPSYTPSMWSGFYGGVHVGYGWGDPQITSTITSFVEPAPGATGILSSTASGTSSSSRSALGGFQAGYNFQSGSWVYGIETDLSVTKLQAAGPSLGASSRVVGGSDTA